MNKENKMSNGNKAFVKVTQNQVYEEIQKLREDLNNFMNQSKLTRKIAVASLSISTFLAGAVIYAWVMR